MLFIQANYYTVSISLSFLYTILTKILDIYIFSFIRNSFSALFLLIVGITYNKFKEFLKQKDNLQQMS